MRAKSNRFTSYAVAKAFYKKLGKPYRAKYLEASLNLRAGSKVCNRLSSFRFKTKGVVAFALSAKKSSTSSKSVRATATAEPIGGLYGIDEEGVATPVISAVDGSAVTLADATAIEKVYTAPDGSVITRYSAHPDKCLIGKVAVGATLEECIVTSSDLPQGFGIGDGGGAAVETTDVVQFDAVGNMYLNIFGLAPQCQQPGTSFAGEGLAQVAADGTVTVFANETCLSQVYSWAPLRTGGVVYLWKPDFNDYRGSLNVWEDGIISTLKKDLITTADGIHTMADGRTLINVSSSGDEVFPGPSRDQGGMLLYTEKAGVATTWYHLASESPVYSHEEVAAPICDCNGLLRDPIAQNSDGLWGVGSLSSTQPNQPTVGGRYLWEMYPKVSTVAKIPTGMAANLLSLTSTTAVVAGPDYLGCTLTTRPAPCQYSMGLIDLSTGTNKSLVSPTDGLAVLTLAASDESDTIIAQAIRLSDKKYMIGVVDSRTKSVTWRDATRLKFRWIGMFK